MNMFLGFELLPFVVINAFIVVYLVLAWSWDLPDESPECIFVEKFRRIIIWTGLQHGWRMFAPHPLRIDRHVQATLKFVDGTIAIWQEPRLAQMNKFKAFLHGKHLSWKHSLVKEDHIRGGYARYLMSRPEFAGSKVASITFFSIEQHVPSPSELKAGKPGKIERTKFFEYIDSEESEQCLAVNS